MENKRLKELVEERKEELLDLCCRMIQIPSVNPPGEVEEIVGFICNYLEKHGISWEIIRPTSDTPNIVAKMGNPDGRYYWYSNRLRILLLVDAYQTL